MSEMWDKIVAQAMTGRGEKLLSGKNETYAIRYDIWLVEY
jgi:hypothetical protein